MKTTELRIGNLIYWDIPEKENVPHEVLSISLDGKIHTTPISLGRVPFDYLPIPLTEEWLVKFGFKPLVKDWQIKGLIIHTRERGFVVRKSMPILQSVHQLQNIYFALTGEELTANNL